VCIGAQRTLSPPPLFADAPIAPVALEAPRPGRLLRGGDAVLAVRFIQVDNSRS
jgi:hypothetical protein